MVRPRLLVGQILDFALASYKGRGQVEERKGYEGLCGRAVSRVDEERGSRPSAVIVLNGSAMVTVGEENSRARFENVTSPALFVREYLDG